MEVVFIVSLNLIKKAKAGSEEAIQEIFKTFQGIMLLKTKKYFFYGGDKDDVLQEAMIRSGYPASVTSVRRFPSYFDSCSK